jgi:uncharacterized DUF497 family protein
MIDFDFIEWDAEEDVSGNVQHIASNGITIDEVEDVLYSPDCQSVQSRSSRRPAVIGETASGKTIIVVYERHKDGREVIVRPVTAYEIEA